MNFKTVKQFSRDNPAFSEGGLRWQIFNENTSGLKESGAIVRMGRKVLIDEDKFHEWLVIQNQGVAA